jgi:hypothetical protein
VTVALAAGGVAAVLSATAAAAACVASATEDVYTGSGNWNVAANWSLGAVPSGTIVACWSAGSTVTVSDTESVDSVQAGGSLQVASGGALTLTSATDQSSVAALSIDGGGTLTGHSGQTVTVTGAFTWGGATAGSATLASATVGAGSVAIAGGTSTPTFTGGTVSTAGAVTAAGSNFAASGSPALTTTSTIGFSTGANLAGSGASFSAAGVTLAATGTSGVGANALTLTGGTTTVASGTTLASGGIKETGGTLQDDGNVGSSVTLTGGTLSGTGTVTGGVTNTSGTVHPGDGTGPGTLTVTGAYSQSAGATLGIAIQNKNNFGQLKTSGAATIAGALALSGGYNPTQGDAFQVFTYGSETGTPFTLSGSNATSYIPTYGATALTLTVFNRPANCSGTTDVFFPATGNSGDWATGGTWLPAVPGSGSTACWATSTTVVVGSGDSETVAAIQGGALDINGGSLTLASSGASKVATPTTTPPGAYALTLTGGGTLNGVTGQILTVSGTFIWSGGNLDTGASNGLAISQPASTSLAISGVGAWGGGSITAPKLTFSATSFTATGTAALTLNGSGTTSSVAAGDTLSVPSLTLSSGTLGVASGALLSFGGTEAISGTINGAGTVLTTGAATLTGTLSASTVDVATGALVVNGGATYNVGTETTIGSGTLTFNANGTTAALTMSGGGELDGKGKTLTVKGAFTWSGGGAINAASGENSLAINQTGSGFAVSGPTASLDGGSIATGSTVTITSSGFVTTGAPTLTTTSQIVLGSSTAVAGSGGAFNANGLGSGAITTTYDFGSDALTLAGGTATFASGGVLKSGPLTLTGGTLQDDGAISPSSTTLTGGTLDGTGTVAGPVTNTSGTVSPGDAGAPGILTLSGTYSQGGGTLAILISGTTPGSGFGQLVVQGSASSTPLAGSLSVSDGGGFIPEPGNTFEVLSAPSAPPQGLLTLTGPGAGSYYVQVNPHDVTLAVNPTPGNAVAPTIGGTPAVGQTLTCSPGSWSAFPTSFAYQWSSDGAAISGATGATYVVAKADQGHSLTCTVTASNGFGAGQPATSAPVSVPPPPSAPAATGSPAVSGTPLPGNTLTCSKGAWSGAPTGFKYQWLRDGAPIAGATGATYLVQIADEGSSLACRVAAFNGVGTGAPATSAAIVVAQPGTLTCAAPSGHLSATALGPIALGATRSRARHAITTFTTFGSVDDFCLFGGWDIHAGYPSARLLRTVPRPARGRLTGRVVLALTVNPYYSLNGARPGMSVNSITGRLLIGKAIHLGHNYWYVVSGRKSNGVLRISGGVIQEVGIANRQLTSSHAAQKRFFQGFNGA